MTTMMAALGVSALRVWDNKGEQEYMYAATFQQRYRIDEHPYIPGVTHRSFLMIETNKEAVAHRWLMSATDNDWACIYPYDISFRRDIKTYCLERLPFMIVPASCVCGGDAMWMHERDTGALESVGCICHTSLFRTVST